MSLVVFAAPVIRCQYTANLCDRVPAVFGSNSVRVDTTPNNNNNNKNNRVRARITRTQAVSKALSLGTSGNITLNVLPRSFRRLLRYAETFSLSTGTAGVIGTVQTMFLNSVYDPNSTGTGHQPYGFDQLAAFYQQYLVHGVRFKIITSTIGGTAEVCVAYQVFPTAGGVSIAGISTDAATEKSTVSTFVQGSSGNVRSRSVGGEVKMYQIFGLTPAQYAAQTDVYGAAVTTNPSLGAYLEIGIGSYSGTASESLSVQVVLDMDVEFWQPKTLPQS